MALRSGSRRAVNPRGDTADKVEAAAIDLIFREGYPKTSIRGITAELGYTPGAFYNHFGSKEELLYAIISKTHASIEATIESALLKAGTDPVRQLWEVCRALTAFYTRRQKEAIISQRETRHLPDRQPEEMLAAQRRIRRTVERVLERGIAAGRFSLELPSGRQADLAVTTKAILDQIINAGVWFRPGGRLSEAELADQYGWLILQMVGVAAGDLPQEQRSPESQDGA
jgi:AcrR family transcriptional regulator